VSLLASSLSQSQTANCTEWNFFDLPAPWAPGSLATGINRWGTVTGFGFHSGSAQTFSFVRYKGGGVTSFMAPNADGTFFKKRNRFGVTVGSYDVNTSAGTRTHGLVVSGNNSVTVDYPNAYLTSLNGINSYGAIVGVHAPKSGNADSFKLKDGTFRRIHYPNSASTIAMDINDQGAIVGNYSDQNFQGHGFIRENGIYKTIDYAKAVPPESAELTAINGSGTIVGFFYNGPIPQSFIYSNGVFKDIVHPNIFYTLVWGINAFGYVVGSTDLNSGGSSMFTAHCE
jgi:hypothetical protein